jgi:hypothetical protein
MTDEVPPSSDALDDADSLVIEQLAQLRGIEPSPAAQERFQRLVAAELDAVRRAPSAPWWRQSIRVPVPVCIAAGLAAIALLFIRLPGAAEHTIRESTASPTSTISPMSATPPAAAATKSEPTRRTNSTYVLGVGPVAMETHYFSTKD